MQFLPIPFFDSGMIPTVAASRVTESKKRKKNLSFDESDQIVGAFVSRLLEVF